MCLAFSCDIYDVTFLCLALSCDIYDVTFLCVQPSELSVFETNIRFVGGLLSAYALTGDQVRTLSP